MAAGLFLITRTDQGVTNDRNRVREVILNNDDGQTNAQHIAQAITGLNASQPVESGANAEPVYPAGYFDTVVQIGATPAGPLATDNDYIAYAPEVVSAKT